MKDYQPNDASRIYNKTLRRDQEIWNLVGNFPLVTSLNATLELCEGEDSLTNGVLKAKLVEGVVLLETTCYDILAKKHQAPSKEFIPKPVAVQQPDTEFVFVASLAEDAPL